MHSIFVFYALYFFLFLCNSQKVQENMFDWTAT